MFNPSSVSFRGPLTSHIGGFWQELLKQGYSPLSGANLLRLAACFSRWLEKRGLKENDITDKVVEAFMAYRRRRGYRHFRTPRALDSLLRYLRGIGVVPAPRPKQVTSPTDRLVEQYAQYLVRERGISASTIRNYTDLAKRFIEARLDNDLKWKRLRPTDITSFVLEERRRWSIGQCKHAVTALRSLLRYLHVSGQIERELAYCVPAVAGWRLAWLPKALEPDQVRRLLRSCDLRSTVGRRDGAIIRLLLRLGLRAGEVAALDLDDFDWRSGQIIVRGKGRSESRLPLPPDVGRSVVAYLHRGRPNTKSRRVFIRSRAPHTALTSGGVITPVSRALRRAGVMSGGAHLLRHTAATQMLRHGAKLADIAHVLRHRHVDTTAIYAKVDYVALGRLAQPWPGGVR